MQLRQLKAWVRVVMSLGIAWMALQSAPALAQFTCSGCRASTTTEEQQKLTCNLAMRLGVEHQPWCVSIQSFSCGANRVCSNYLSYQPYVGWNGTYTLPAAMQARNYYVRSSNVALVQYYPGGDLTKGAVGVANTPAGGWIEFEVYSPTTREYRVAFIYKTISSGATLAMDVDGVPAIGAFALPNASGYWYSLDLGFSNLRVTLSAGYHRIRFKLSTGSVYFDSFGLE